VETLNVLVCDDERGMRLGVTRALRDHHVELPELGGGVNFAVSETETGEECLERIHQAPPNILLLDHKLPGISGLDVLDELARHEFEDMLTIMITAYASIETAVRATKQGAYDFLPKPFTPGELRTTVGKAAKHLLVARQARKLAEEKRRVRFEFIRVVAHELKSPINAIEGYLNVLSSGAVKDQATVDEIIGRCTVRIGGMRKMITDLLDLTRIESGQKPRQIETVDACEVATMAVEGVLPETQDRGITTEVHCDGPVTLEADRSELEIIFNNLVTNAVKYNKDGGRVDVRVERKDNAVVIQVSDTGIGMTEEDAARLFNDFVRIKNAKTSGILGSGLGLSILKKLTTLYNGDIRVKSKPDEGSTFTVTLRETSDAEAEAAAAASTAPES
jgi:signal transduction histidine kinase